MKNFIVIGLITVAALGLFSLIEQTTPIYPIANAGAAINYSNVNYTNIYENKTYMDIVKEARAFKVPARDLDFGITISKTCYQMNKHNVSSNCPSYESIMLLFPDTSYPEISGGFIYKDNQLQREKPPMEDSYKYYAFKNQTYLFIDPDTETKKQLGMIVIESRLPEYPINYKVENNTRVMGEGRYIDNCRNAVIGSENWINLLGDTIQFMRHDCHPTFTFFNDNKTIYQEKTKHDITTSSKWLHDKFLEFVKENCLYEYDVC